MTQAVDEFHPKINRHIPQKDRHTDISQPDKRFCPKDLSQDIHLTCQIDQTCPHKSADIPQSPQALVSFCQNQTADQYHTCQYTRKRLAPLLGLFYDLCQYNAGKKTKITSASFILYQWQRLF